jgi:hypothetical protein
MAFAIPQIKRLNTGAITQSLTTAYYSPRTVLSLNVGGGGPVGGKPTDFASSKFPMRISGIYLEVTTIAAGATTLTMRITRDSNADFCIVPEATATIATGVTTATSGSVVFKVETDALLETKDLFLTVRTNAGTAVLTKAVVTYETNLY